MTEIEVEAPGPNGPLRGALLAADATKTAPVLIIPGSGPTDRDGNSPLGIRASTYRLLAEGLGAQGISTLRIDKRGLFGSASAIPDADAVTIDDYVEDAHVWNVILRERTGASCVWLLGHSEGGLVALAAAAKHPTDFCGLILVAAPGRRLGTILREQLRANPANALFLAEAEQAIDALEAGRRVDGAHLHPALRPLFRPEVQDFLIDAFALDPAELIARCPRPVLILQPGRDHQVSRTDAEHLKAAKPDAELHVSPGTSHVLKPVASDDTTANLATYGAIDLALAPDIIPTIATFVHAHAPEP